MKLYKAITLLLLGLSLSVSAAQETINIKLSDIDENGNVTINLKLNIEQAPVVVDPPVEPEPEPNPEPPIDTGLIYEINYPALFDGDIAEFMPVSTIDNPHIPLGLSAQLDIEFIGAFRVSYSASHAVGALGYNPDNHSLFMALIDTRNEIAEYKIPDTLSKTTIIKDIVDAEVLQRRFSVLGTLKEASGYELDNSGNYVWRCCDARGKKTRTRVRPAASNKITGLLAYENSLLVTNEIWYDGGGNNVNNIKVLNKNDLPSSDLSFKQLEGKARIAGYMSYIPESMQAALGGTHLVGWASNYSITSRYSQGPSLAVFNPQDAIDNNIEVPVDIKMVFPHGDTEMVKGGDEYKKDISPIWGPLAKARYGFIVPNTSIFFPLGSQGGINGGIGYKITQDNGNKCGGQCTYKANDTYNYFWLFDINEMLSADNTHEPRPFSYGKWMMPFKGQIIGAVFDNIDTLYIAINDAGRIGEFDRPPLIVAYKITAKGNL